MKLWIIVKPGARENKMELLPSGEWKVSVKAPPVDGKANEAVIRVLAEHFKVTRAQISIRAGASGKKKLVEIL